MHDNAFDDNARAFRVGRASSALDSLVGDAISMRKLRALLPVFAESSAPVLITGETGSGKELVARALHELGDHADAPFVAVNCAAVPSTLFESELFGHEQGSFTGAHKRTRGRLEEAGAGTLLLDEVGEMPLEQQAKLLRAIGERSFRAVGGERDLPFAARVLAATHVDLGARVARGEFRSDLFFRLNVLAIRVPSLAERKDDMLAIAERCLLDVAPRARVTADAAALLALRAWPGNVRELRSVLERAAALAGDGPITASLLRHMDTLFVPDASAGSMADLAARLHRMPGTLTEKLGALEHHLIAQALQASGGNQAEAARALGVHRKWLERRVHAAARHDDAMRPNAPRRDASGR
jgi:DNA-binding NtrC family response regulator